MQSSKKILAISCVVIITLVGCSRNVMKKSDTQSNFTFPKRYEKTLGKVQFDTELILQSNEVSSNVTKGYAIPKKIKSKREDFNQDDENAFFEFSTNSRVAERFDECLQNELSRAVLETIENEQPQILEETYSFLQEFGLSDVLLEKGARNTSAGEEIVLLGSQEFQGIPVINSLYYNYANDGGSPIRALIINGCIEKVQILYCYEFQKLEEEISLLPFERIAEAIGKEFEQILTDNCYKVVEAKLCFLVETDMEKEKHNMIPVWLMEIHEYSPNGVIESFYEAVHAETGKILEVEE